MDDTNLDRKLNDIFIGRWPGFTGLMPVPEFLCQEFSTLDLNKALDEALLGWLLRAKETEKSQRRRLSKPVYASRICDALITAQLLDLPKINQYARENIDSWIKWLRPLRIAPERDPALECWRLVTLRQPSDQSNIFEWLSLSVDSRDEYLQVALTGIKRSPQPNKRATHITLAGALILHTLVNDTPLDSKYKFIQKHVSAMRAECTKEFLASLPFGYWEKILSDAMSVLGESSKSGPLT